MTGESIPQSQSPGCDLAETPQSPSCFFSIGWQVEDIRCPTPDPGTPVGGVPRWGSRRRFPFKDKRDGRVLHSIDFSTTKDRRGQYSKSCHQGAALKPRKLN